MKTGSSSLDEGGFAASKSSITEPEVRAEKKHSELLLYFEDKQFLTLP